MIQSEIEKRICWFCFKDIGGNAANVDVELQRNLKSKYVFPNSREYTYEQRFVVIPRCKDCEHKHSLASIISGAILSIGIVTSVAISFKTGLSVLILIISLAAWFVGKQARMFYLRAKGIKDYKNISVGEFPEIASFLVEGWKVKRNNSLGGKVR